MFHRSRGVERCGVMSSGGKVANFENALIHRGRLASLGSPPFLNLEISPSSQNFPKLSIAAITTWIRHPRSGRLTQNSGLKAGIRKPK
jgi:hypothetical protein